jgi:hypothetical protein
MVEKVKKRLNKTKEQFLPNRPAKDSVGNEELSSSPSYCSTQTDPAPGDSSWKTP